MKARRRDGARLASAAAGSAAHVANASAIATARALLTAGRLLWTAMAKGKKRKVAPGDVATNRYASFRYDLTDRLECGVVLAGTEVKALRSGTAQIKDGYAQVRDGELWLHNVHIPPYGPASRENHDPDRPRKLLAHKREIERMVAKTQERGLTLVPTRIYFSGAARQGRDRAGPRQGPLRQARVDEVARPAARHRARDQRALLTPARQVQELLARARVVAHGAAQR